MSSICSIGGSIVVFSTLSCACYFLSHSFSSISFIYGSPISSSHSYTLSLKRFVHSSSTFLFLETAIISIHTLPLCTSSGILGLLLNCKSCIYAMNPFMTPPIFNNYSSIVASITRGSFGTSLYNY
jgi:hypothetical protein